MAAAKKPTTEITNNGVGKGKKSALRTVRTAKKGVKTPTKGQKSVRKPVAKPQSPKIRAGLSFDEKVQLVIDRGRKRGATISRGSEYSLPWLTLRRPTGLLSLDIRCAGGLPAGGVTQFIGPPGVGKNWMVNNVIAQVQKYYGSESAAAVACSEGRYDKIWAKNDCGVRVALSEDEIADLEYTIRTKDPSWGGFTEEELDYFRDQIGTGVIEIIGETAEKMYEGVLEAVASNLFQVVAIDSLGSLLVKQEDEGTMEDKVTGGASGVNAQFMRKLSALLCKLDESGRANETSIVFLNQWREFVRQNMYQRGPKREFKEGGGWSVKHGQLLNIKLEAGPFVREGEAEDSRVIGKRVDWEIIKQKAGGHEGHKGSYLFRFANPHGADFVDDMVSAGLLAGVIDASGTWFSLLDESREKAIFRSQGRKTFVEKLRTAYRGLQNYIELEVLKHFEIRRRCGPRHTTTTD